MAVSEASDTIEPSRGRADQMAQFYTDPAVSKALGQSSARHQSVPSWIETVAIPLAMNTQTFTSLAFACGSFKISLPSNHRP